MFGATITTSCPLGLSSILLQEKCLNLICIAAVLCTLACYSAPAAEPAYPESNMTSCHELALGALRDAAAAAANANACNRLDLKVRQIQLAIDISVISGMNEGEAGKSLYEEFIRQSALINQVCGIDVLIESVQKFNKSADRVMALCWDQIPP